MNTAAPELSLWEVIEFRKQLTTWFGVGGFADRYAEPRSVEMVRDVLLAFAGHRVHIIGEGANLLVGDDGVDGIVMSLKRLRGYSIIDESDDGNVTLHAEAGVSLAKLVQWGVREGLQGLETLVGIPASIGGALVMNAGGAFGSTGPLVRRVHAFDKIGREMWIPADEIDFRYRASGLGHLVIVGAELSLKRVPNEKQPKLRDRLSEIQEFKKRTQPMTAKSAGCCFKNPTVPAALASRVTGQPYNNEETISISAGLLIDRAGCKGLTVGGASISERHANFVITQEGATASDILELMDEVSARVRKAFGVVLEREVQVWQRAM